MSNMMIYARKGAVGGNIENVWGYKLRVRAIDTTDKEAVESAKADGWSKTPQDVIDGLKLERQNSAMQAVVGDTASKGRIAELESELKEATSVIDEKIARIAELESKLAIYEEAKDVNGDDKVSYDEMTRDELKVLLTQREYEFNERDSKDTLVQHAKDSESTDSE